MADQPVNVLDGIGEKTLTALRHANLGTVGQLAKAHPEDEKIRKIRGIKNHIFNAQQYLKQEESPVCHIPDLFVIRSGVVPVETKASTPPPASEPKVEEVKQLEQYLIQNHTWFEERVKIPVESPGGIEFQEAVCCELTVQPGDLNQVMIICQWSDEDGLKHIYDRPFPPMFLFHFNDHLPPLELVVKPECWEKLPAKPVIEETLYFTNLMHSTARHMDHQLSVVR